MMAFTISALTNSAAEATSGPFRLLWRRRNPALCLLPLVSTEARLMIPMDPSPYAWDFGDATTSTAPSLLHSYNAAGSYTALLRVTDNAGSTASTSHTITVKPLAAPVLSASISSGAVRLTWTDGSGSSVTGWTVERKTKNKAWTIAATVTNPAYTDTPASGNWTYRVRSFNSVAVSAYSNEVTVRVR
jgi:PKD repeat protein